MHLAGIELHNFRSYSKQYLEFAASGSLVIGRNGCGKTNLLEAIAYCGLGKSIRFHSDEHLVRIGEPFFAINARFILDTGLEMGVAFSFDGKKKLLSLDGLPAKQLSSLLESIKIIYCAPEDVNIIGGAPKQRRQYFDLAISQVYPGYLKELRDYLHIVEQRNSLLKTTWQERVKKVWDERFAEAYLKVIDYRHRYLEILNTELKEGFTDFSESIRDFSVQYLYSIKNHDQATISRDSIIDALKQIEAREKLAEFSIVGAHLDDYRFLLNTRGIKSFGSGGQKRILVLLMKLVQASLVSRVSSIKPILLFDDIFAELDELHSKKIRDLINHQYQIFISSPKSELISLWETLPVIYPEATANEA